MTRIFIAALLLSGLVVAAPGAPGPLRGQPSPPASAARRAETRYLTFQLMTGLPGYAGPPPAPGHFAPSREQVAAFARDVARTIGSTGDARHKLGFAVGPLCFDMPDAETRQFIHDSFAVAREVDMAVAFHIDDSMSWGHRRDLLANPDNLETADWKQAPNTGRRADWGPSPTRFPPQMCFNSPQVIAAVRKRAALIGAQIRREVRALAAAGRSHLFAGVIAGWETGIGRDFDTGRSLGYRALGHRGFSAARPPRDADMERVGVVREFMELWGRSLSGAGVPRGKVFCHIAFTDQGLRPADSRGSRAEHVQFALPEVAFSPVYRPGFSTYPEGATFRDVHAALVRHGSPGWISAEGTNVSPTGMPGEPTMESYLGRMFNHGAVWANLFSWGMGGEAMRGNFFRRATEGAEALAAYRRFLRGELLVEAATGFSAQGFQERMRRIQRELPSWAERAGQAARQQATGLARRIEQLTKDRQWQEADRVAAELLTLISP